MISITKLPGYSEFTKECKFFYCKNPDVYGQDWSGAEDYIVTSDTSEEIIKRKYPEIMQALSPYLFCGAACGAAIADGMRNTQKFQKREAIYTHYSLDEDFEQNLSDHEDWSCSYPIETVEMRMMIEEAMQDCTDIEKERIIKYFFHGMTLEKIACGKNPSSIMRAIDAGLKKIRKNLA